jgi:hypothetical protein
MLMSETARAWKSFTKVVTVYPTETIASSAATLWLSNYNAYGLTQVHHGNTTPLTYFEAYNTGDFMAASLLSIGANALLAVGIAAMGENVHIPVWKRRLAAFGIASAIVILGETVLPKGLLGNTPDVLDIPMGIAGAALPILVGGTGERIIDTTFGIFTKSSRQKPRR